MVKRRSGKPRMPRQGRPPRPKVKILKQIYEGLFSPLVTNRLQALSLALQWYDQALAWVLYRKKGVLSPEENKTLGMAMKLRSQGMGTPYEPKRETAFRKAIQRFQQVCKQMQPTDVEEVYKEVDQRMNVLEAKQQRLSDKFGDVLQMIAKALQPKNHSGQEVKLVPSPGVEPRQFNHELNTMAYNRPMCKQLAVLYRQGGLLPVLIQEMKQLSRAASLHFVDDGAGGSEPAYDQGKELASVYSMLDNLAKFCQSEDAPRRIAKTNYKAKAISSTSGPKVPRKAPVRGGPRIDGLYAEGSAVGILYAELKAGEWQEKAKLQGMITSNLHRRLSRIKREGKKHGWVLEEQGDKVRMVKQ